MGTDIDGLDELVAPLRARLAELDQTHEDLTEELKQLQVRRARIRKTIALLADEKPVKKRAKGRNEVAPETLEKIWDWIQSRSTNGGFSGPDLFRDGYTLTSDATLNHALRTFHERGQIRLDHRGKGGAKVFKLVK